MSEYLKIGEISSLFHLDVQTLRLYDERGLLKPEARIPENNYRLYRFNQVYPLALIRYLRRLGCPLSEIKAFMEERSLPNTGDYLRAQSKQLRAQCQELLHLDSVIQMKLHFIEQENALYRPEELSVRHEEKIAYADLGNSNQVFRNELFYLYPTIAFYEGPEPTFGAYLMNTASALESAEDAEKTDILEIPAGDFLEGYHIGPYETIQETFERMRRAARSPLDPRIICLNIIDQFVEVNAEKFVTKVMMRITADA